MQLVNHVMHCRLELIIGPSLSHWKHCFHSSLFLCSIVYIRAVARKIDINEDFRFRYLRNCHYYWTVTFEIAKQIKGQK